LPEATAKSQSPAARKEKLPIVTTPHPEVFLGRMADGVFPVSSLRTIGPPGRWPETGKKAKYIHLILRAKAKRSEDWLILSNFFHKNRIQFRQNSSFEPGPPTHVSKEK
jgi:hypothetical protein